MTRKWYVPLWARSPFVPYTAQQVQIAEKRKEACDRPRQTYRSGFARAYTNLDFCQSSGQFAGVFRETYSYAEVVVQVG